MGTAPDLITIRGVEVIKSADIILVGDEQERDLWKDFIKDNESSLRIRYQRGNPDSDGLGRTDRRQRKAYGSRQHHGFLHYAF
jgi:precorrin-2 methylase